MRWLISCTARVDKPTRMRSARSFLPASGFGVDLDIGVGMAGRTSLLHRTGAGLKPNNIGDEVGRCAMILLPTLHEISICPLVANPTASPLQAATRCAPRPDRWPGRRSGHPQQSRQDSSHFGLYRAVSADTPRNTQIIRGRSDEHRVWNHGVQRGAGRTGKTDPGKQEPYSVPSLPENNDPLRAVDAQFSTSQFLP